MEFDNSKKICDQVVFIQEIPRYFNIHKSINIIEQ